VGFGLFAVLAMIRLRSEPFSHPEFAYFFLALVLALACGVGLPIALTAGLCAIALATALVADHPRILRPARTLEVTLDSVLVDRAPLRARLEARLAAEVVDASVLEVDEVREVTRVRVTCRDPRPSHVPPHERARRNGAVDVGAR
jgi:hypothetical protein